MFDFSRERSSIFKTTCDVLSGNLSFVSLGLSDVKDTKQETLEIW